MITGFNKKENKAFFNKQLLFKTLGVVFIIIISLLILQDIKIYQKKKRLISQINTYEQQIEDLKKSGQKLKEEIANADNQDYLEKLAYEQMGQQRPGEEQIIFITRQEEVEATPASENFFHNKWFNWLPNIFSWMKSKF